MFSGTTANESASAPVMPEPVASEVVPEPQAPQIPESTQEAFPDDSASEELELSLDSVFDNSPEDEITAALRESREGRSDAVDSAPEKMESEAQAEDASPSDKFFEPVRYKAYGKDYEVKSKEELVRKLAESEGAKQKFSKAAELEQGIKSKLKGRDIDSVIKEAELLQKFNNMAEAGDWKQLLEVASGKKASEVIAEVQRREDILTNGTDLEKRQLLESEELAAVKHRLALKEKQDQEDIQRLTAEKDARDAQQMQYLIDSEFSKHKFDSENTSQSELLNRRLRKDAKDLMNYYINKNKDHPNLQKNLGKIAEVSFKQAADEIRSLFSLQVESKVDQVIRNKQQKAEENVKVAAGRKINNSGKVDISGKGVRDTYLSLIKSGFFNS